MKLQAYLSEKDISLETFAKLVGASTFGVRKWIRGERLPRKNALKRIGEVTGGEVTAVDFLDMAA
jgi:hypothetical protein